MVKIIKVKSKKHIKIFNNFPTQLYNSCDYYVPKYYRDERKLFNQKKNDSLESNQVAGYLAYQDGNLVGRALGIINRVEIDNGEKVARIYNIDFINDKEVSYALFDAVESWAKLCGASKIITPYGFDEFTTCGLLTYGFECLPTIQENYNFPYYAEHFSSYGYTVESEFIEYYLRPKAIESSSLIEYNINALEKYDLKMLDLKDKGVLSNYSKKICDFLFEYNNTNHSSIISEKVLKKFTKLTSNLTDKEYSVIVVNKNDDIVGVMLTGNNASRSLQLSGGRVLSEVYAGWQGNQIVLDIYSIAYDRENKCKALEILFNHLSVLSSKYKIDFIESNISLNSEKLLNVVKKNFNISKSKIRATYYKKI